MEADEILQFVVDFNGVHLCVVGKQPLGKAQCRVAGECAQFEHLPRVNHAHKHLEQPSLQMARTHAWTQVIEVRFAVETRQFGRFAVDVLQYVVV